MNRKIIYNKVLKLKIYLMILYVNKFLIFIII